MSERNKASFVGEEDSGRSSDTEEGSYADHVNQAEAGEENVGAEEEFDDEEESDYELEEWELWHAAYDQAGRTYYYNEETGAVTWVRPECMGPDLGNGTTMFFLPLQVDLSKESRDFRFGCSFHLNRRYSCLFPPV
jgi:hypothetical protein